LTVTLNFATPVQH